MNYREATEWLYSTQLFGIKLGLEGPTQLLRDFLAFPSHRTKVIHVAGTNGKGSTCAMIDSLGRNLGLRTGLFTSPHLVDFRERIRVSGGEISEEKTARLLTEIRALVADWDPHPTFFEITLAIAMRHFRDSGCELLVLETGMGGRLDATTAVPADVCVLTSIAMDHSKWLGDTLTKIAEEKTGIAVEGKPLISAPQDSEAELAIKRTANQKRAPLDFIEGPLMGYSLSLSGEHQRENAALACEAMTAAGYYLNFDVVQYALANTDWPGRFERATQNLILDAAHNPQAADALVATFSQEFPGKKAQIIFGAVEDKHADKLINILESIACHFHFVPVDSPRGLPPESHHTELPSTVHHSLPQALDATKDSLTLLTGSLFLLGQAKGFLQSKITRQTSQ
ncbi:MAG: bifunctional folylpolyglutamate synthase/dihydrofolate synthase [Akkermansiaceae bacterium]